MQRLEVGYKNNENVSNLFVSMHVITLSQKVDIRNDPPNIQKSTLTTLARPQAFPGANLMILVDLQQLS